MDLLIFIFVNVVKGHSECIGHTSYPWMAVMRRNLFANCQKKKFSRYKFPWLSFVLYFYPWISHFDFTYEAINTCKLCVNKHSISNSCSPAANVAQLS